MIDELLNKLFTFNEYKRYKLTEDILLKISEYTKDNIQELFKDSIKYKLLESEDNEFYILKTNIYFYENYNKNNFYIISCNNHDYNIYIDDQKNYYINENNIVTENKRFEDWIGTNHSNKSILLYSNLLKMNNLILQFKDKGIYIHIKLAIVFSNWTSINNSYNILSLFENILINNIELKKEYISQKCYYLNYKNNKIIFSDKNQILFNKKILLDNDKKISDFNILYSKNIDNKLNKINMFYNTIILINNTTEKELINLIDKYF
jgi:hypothetical protein